MEQNNNKKNKAWTTRMRRIGKNGKIALRKSMDGTEKHETSQTNRKKWG